MHLPTAWSLPPAVVIEAQCIAHGDDACIYRVHWFGEACCTPVILAAVLPAIVLAGTSVGTWTMAGACAVAAGLAHAAERRRVDAANRLTAARFGTAFREAAARLAPPTVHATTAAATANDDAPVFRQDGEVWLITFEGKTVLVPQSRGLALLVHLLRNPGEEIHVTALDAFIPSDAAAGPRAAGSIDASTARDLGDAGEVLDAQAKSAYRRRVAEIRKELEDAEACNDPGRVGSARAELEAIASQLHEATGLGGRSRRAASNVERVRVAVTRRIRSAITQIGKLHPALGAHLTSSIRTGYSCSYNPAAPHVWRT